MSREGLNWRVDAWNIKDLKRRHLVMCLLHTGGNIMKAARYMGMTAKSINNQVNQFSLKRLLMLLRLAQVQGRKVDDIGLKAYAQSNAAQEGIINRTLCNINQGFKLDGLLKEISDLKFVYEKSIDTPVEGEEVRERRAFKENENPMWADGLHGV